MNNQEATILDSFEVNIPSVWEADFKCFKTFQLATALLRCIVHNLAT